MKRSTGRFGRWMAATGAALVFGVMTTAAAAEGPATPAAGRSLVVQAGAAAAAAVETTPDDPEKPQDGNGGSNGTGAPDTALGRFFQDVEISGLVDGYYAWASNKTSPVLHAFDVNHNEISLSYAEIAIGKPASEGSRAGFRMDFGAGQTADLVNAFEPGGTDYLKYVQQAYVSYLAPIGKGLTIDFGKFVTPAGAELIETGDNYNYSRGLLFTLAIPFYHMGARVSYAPTDKVTVTGFLLNGWNNVRENNSDKTVAVSVGVTPTDKLSITQNYMVGKESPTGFDGNVRHLLDTVVSYTVSDRLSVLGNFDYGHDGLDGETVDWAGLAAALRYQVNDYFAVSPRYEILTDDKGFATGSADNRFQEVTLTGEFKVSDVITRVEWRTDFARLPYFEKDDGTIGKRQNVFLVGLIYGFSTK